LNLGDGALIGERLIGRAGHFVDYESGARLNVNPSHPRAARDLEGGPMTLQGEAPQVVEPKVTNKPNDLDRCLIQAVFVLSAT
jgi:hypothetical protein